MANATETKPVLMMGDYGVNVSILQTTLSELGYDPGPIDGIFGIKTEHAVKTFQSDWNLLIDGIVGPKTWAALDKATAGEKPVPGIARVLDWIKAHKLLTGGLVGLAALGIYLVVRKK